MKGYLIFCECVAVFLMLACRHHEQQNDKIMLKPQLSGDSWRICEMPDLGELNGPDPARQHVVDHSFIKAENGQWQLWACIRGTAVGRLLYRWKGSSLVEGPWIPAGIAARADSTIGEKVIPDESIQAPYFLHPDDGYYCFYTSNGARIMRSEDGLEFKRFMIRDDNNILYKESGRDMMVMKQGSLYYSYSTISTVAGDGWKYGFIILRTSADLKRWSDYTIVCEGGIGGNGPISAESPFVIRVEGYYYLFRSSSVTAKTYVYRSDTPYNFGVNDDKKLIETLQLKAPEIINSDGDYYISDLADFKGIKLTRLKWIPDR